MQCHLGGCRSIGCDLTLELFTRGLASEDANENAQPVVAAIVRDASRCCMSSLPLIALPSRPNHNAAAPCVKLISAFGLTHQRGHHVIAKFSADRRPGQARQPARDGAKRSGLTG
jgi:hypothetical protein